MKRAILEELKRLAGGCCDYCQMVEQFDPLPFQVDHIIAVQHGGETIIENLAWSCLHCNKHKGPNLAGIDPLTHQMTPLFHPRRQRWQRHFSWDNARIVGRTKVGRSTIRTLAMNDPDFVEFRLELMIEGVFNPMSG